MALSFFTLFVLGARLSSHSKQKREHIPKHVRDSSGHNEERIEDERLKRVSKLAATQRVQKKVDRIRREIKIQEDLVDRVLKIRVHITFR